MLPSRHLSSLTDIVEFPPLPNNLTWSGDIAYLDRDGVLNVGSENYINTVDELEVLPGAASAIARIRNAGFRVCIVTNQSPVGRGLWDHQRLAEVNAALQTVLLGQNSDAHMELILYSPYVPWANAWARKGNPGMLQVGRQIIDATEIDKSILKFDYGIDYQPRDEGNSFMVGDRIADMKAGLNHGVRTFRCDEKIGLNDVIERVLDFSDNGDSL
jgi:histidinol-phosphate phosphatase family protein